MHSPTHLPANPSPSTPLPSYPIAYLFLSSSSSMEKSYLVDVATKLYLATDSNPVDSQTYELCSDLVDVITDISCIYGVSSSHSQSFGPFDHKSQSAIHLESGIVLYLREVNTYLAVVCVLREENFARRALLDHNIDVLRSLLNELLS